MRETILSENQKQYIGLTVLVFILLVLLYRWYCHLMLGQMEAPVLQYPFTDDLYWLFVFSDISSGIVQHKAVAVTFDILLFAMLGVTILLRKWFMYILLFVFFLTYYILYNLYVTHHSHSLIGPLFMLIPFFFPDSKKFMLTFEAVRYYLLFIFASAAIWKITRGSVWLDDQMVLTLKSQHITFMLFNQDSWQYNFILYLLNNPDILNLLQIVVVLVQIAFFTGFFTKKYDTQLFLLFILFLVSNYFIMRVNFFELTIMGVTLLPWAEIFQRLKIR